MQRDGYYGTRKINSKAPEGIKAMKLQSNNIGHQQHATFVQIRLTKWLPLQRTYLVTIYIHQLDAIQLYKTN
jgi:hypothetical protein